MNWNVYLGPLIPFSVEENKPVKSGSDQILLENIVYSFV